VLLVIALPASVAVELAPLVRAAARHELVVVYGGEPRSLVPTLRGLLPRFTIIELAVSAQPSPAELALVEGLLNEGALPVVQAHSDCVRLVAAVLDEALNADAIVCIGAGGGVTLELAGLVPAAD
jgi:hypothetical protein